MREDSNHCETFLLSVVSEVTGFTVIMEYECDQFKPQWTYPTFSAIPSAIKILKSESLEIFSLTISDSANCLTYLLLECCIYANTDKVRRQLRSSLKNKLLTLIRHLL